MNKDHGGPAFPVPLNPGEPYQGHSPFDGMTLRDYFAAQVVCGLQQVLWKETMVGKFHSGSDVISDMAAAAYEAADAMLKARKEGGGE
ncbi:hypothetical protein [Pseudomonas aeruginosa]|uniref:hypothetical protein n=1 Tax=Pseudomonas aeruginosa TaxID=287 RepID=UPI0021ADE8C4|nr:hypothetical protein [Pseudomonas aeruginosa]